MPRGPCTTPESHARQGTAVNGSPCVGRARRAPAGTVAGVAVGYVANLDDELFIVAPVDFATDIPLKLQTCLFEAG